MAQLVLLNLGEGHIEAGLPLVTLQFCSESLTGRIEVAGSITGALPPAQELSDIYHRWRLLYELIYRARSVQIRGETAESSEPFPLATAADDEGIEINESDITHVSDQDFSDLCALLKQRLNTWLDSTDFRDIDRQLRMRLSPHQDTRFIIQTADPFLRQLPWCIWQFFDDYPHTEVALSALSYDHLPSVSSRSTKVRILAILGNSTGIDVNADEAILRTLPNAEVELLSEPTREDFNDALWQADGWDILFFAGHSANQGATGAMQINANEWLTVAQLRNGLNYAIRQGLQFAIFNSCDGLGLAAQLSDLNIPQMVVMREPIPDRVAQEFLKYFLTFFANGTPFAQSVRSARERLQGLEREFPGASWLPVISQNPSTIPKQWSQLTHRSVSAPSHSPPPLPDLDGPNALLPPRPATKRSIGFPTLAITVLVMGMRWLGVLQPLELRMWDMLLRSRPPAPPDDRIVIVTIDADDIAYQDQQSMPRQGSLADQALLHLLQTISPHHPAIVGLDIYRDPPILDPMAASQVDQFRHRSSSVSDDDPDRAFALIDICQIAGGQQQPEIAPPPTARPEQVGFSDIPRDPDWVIRRQILGMAPGRPDGCFTSQSLSFLVAQRYLARHGVTVQRSSSTQITVGDRTFTKITSHSGGYHRGPAGGFEVMLNYRSTNTISTVPLRFILDGSKPAELEHLFKDRIVLIGNIDGSYKDYHLTPYSRTSARNASTPGVEIQAQMISQVISAGLDQRAVVWWWPQWGDALWVGLWALASAGIGVWIHRSRSRYRVYYGAIALGMLLVVLGGSCFVVLWQAGGWLPLVPSAIATTLAAPTIYVTKRQFSK